MPADAVRVRAQLVKFPLIHFVPLAGALLVAIFWDLRWRKIPNAICGAVAIGGLGVQFWDSGALAALGALGAGVVTMPCSICSGS